jgi:TFIIF-interacting CTD phosphatase-like protein
MMKDISRFKNRDIRRSVLLDPKPVNYIMTPENCMPVMEYTAEYASGKNGMTD